MQHACCSYSTKSGFSLVELSIVLVILGLLVGGVLGGQALIRASELRSITLDRDKYISAIRTFKDKYHSLPGDMANATQIWGAAHATPATCINTVSVGNATCNGNGDGRVGDFSGSVCATVCNYETFRMWQQLAAAGMIEGNYTGTGVTALPATYYARVGYNIPASKVPSAGFLMFWVGSFSNAGWYNSNYNNLFVYGAVLFDNWTYGPIITTQEAWSIDNKSDDGRPSSGNIMSFKPGSGDNANCATSDTASIAEYKLSYSGNACSLLLKTGI